MLSHLPLIQLTHAHKQVTQAYMLGKTCIGYQTDSRRFALDYNNLMIENALNGGLARSLDDP